MYKRIYLDYAATTPVDPEVEKAMEPYHNFQFGNASSVHAFGQQAAKAVDEARVTIARFLNCHPTEVIFTSGATESNNTAIKGVVYYYLHNVISSVSEKSQGKNPKSKIQNPNEYQISNIKNQIPHIVTTAIEHPSVLESCQALEKLGLAEVTYVKPQSNGIVRVQDIIKSIKKNTILISVMYTNNEVGTIQPIREIGRKLKELREQKGQKEIIRYPFFHTDATQAVQFLPGRVDKLGVDMLSMSAHKIYGPKGIGALYVKKGTPIRRFLDGGAQEFDLRAGTLNTPAIVGFGVAVAKLEKLDMLEKLRNKFIHAILQNISATSLNGDPVKRLPNNINIRFNGVDGQMLVMALDQEGVAASAGSACASGAPEPSHVIKAMLGEQAAKESVRFTIGKFTTKIEITQTVKVLRAIVGRIRNS